MPTKGDRQGYILIRVMFNIFLSDLLISWKSAEHLSPIIGNSRELNCILWADDLILLSKTEEGLTKMLSKLSTYSKHNLLQIHSDKTKCMIFNRTCSLIGQNIKFADISIKIVNI